MSVKPQDKQPATQETQERQQQLALIGQNVLHILGQPKDLQRMQVRRVWEDHYRVNVLLGPDTTSVRVAHSYFLVADEGGNIVASTPQIRRKY